MNFYYLLSAYLFSVVITYPLLLKHATDAKKEEPDLFTPFTAKFSAQVGSFIPVFNLVLFIVAIRDSIHNWLLKKGRIKAARNLRNQFKDSDPELKEKIETIASFMENFKNGK